jgi:hypothetical protein
MYAMMKRYPPDQINIDTVPKNRRKTEASALRTNALLPGAVATGKKPCGRTIISIFPRCK